MISRMLKLLCVVMLMQSANAVEIKYENPKRKGGRHDMFPYWINEKINSQRKVMAAVASKVIVLKRAYARTDKHLCKAKID